VKKNGQKNILIFILVLTLAISWGYFIFGDRGQKPLSEYPEKIISNSSPQLAPSQNSDSLKRKFICPKGMVPVSGYSTPWFWIRLADGTHKKKKGKLQRIDTFCMDIYEFPNIHHHLPRTEVSFLQAQELCRNEGKRLCSEFEWERACSGINEWAYSYGPEKENFRCNTDGVVEGDSGFIAPSGSHPGCKNRWGVYDLNGNVSEWVDAKEPGNLAVLRGGAPWKSHHYGQSCFSRHAHPINDSSWLDDGFRCCADSKRSNGK